MIKIVASFLTFFLLFAPLGTFAKTAVSQTRTYTDNVSGFSFNYPASWTLKDGASRIYFQKKPEIQVLNVEKIGKVGTLLAYANGEIKKYGCPADKILEQTKSSVLFVQACSLTSEDYRYMFKLKNGEAIIFAYHDDFDANSAVKEKIKSLKAIIKSLKVFVPTLALYENKEQGFSFLYPIQWQVSGGTDNQFENFRPKNQSENLSFNMWSAEKSHVSVQEIKKQVYDMFKVGKNYSCGDKKDVFIENDKGIAFIDRCQVGSESYDYFFKTKTGVVSLEYTSSALKTEKKKVARVKPIFESVTLLQE